MLFFFFKQKTAYEMRISDWSSSVLNPHHIRLHCEPGASSTDFELYIDGQFADSGTVAFEVRAPRTIKFGAGFTTPADPPVMTDKSYGYFTFWESSSAPTAAEMYEALIGFPGETTGERIQIGR